MPHPLYFPPICHVRECLPRGGPKELATPTALLWAATDTAPLGHLLDNGRSLLVHLWRRHSTARAHGARRGASPRHKCGSPRPLSELHCPPSPAALHSFFVFEFLIFGFLMVSGAIWRARRVCVNELVKCSSRALAHPPFHPSSLLLHHFSTFFFQFIIHMLLYALASRPYFSGNIYLPLF